MKVLIHRRIASLIALVGAPILWALQEWLGWYLTSNRCPGAGESRAALAPPIPQTALNMAFLVGAVAMIALALLGWNLGRSTETGIAATREREAFVAGAGVLTSTVFALAVVWGAFAPFVLPPCMTGR